MNLHFREEKYRDIHQVCRTLQLVDVPVLFVEQYKLEVGENGELG